MIGNNKGQISLFALVLLPVVLAVIGGLFLLAVGLKTEARAVAKCRLQMEKSQAEAAQHLNDLIKLNPEAKRLKQQQKTAQKLADAAELTRIPHAIAAAKTYLLYVKIKRGMLAVKQQKLIFKGRAATKDATRLAEQSIRSSFGPSISNVIADIKSGPQSKRSGFFAVRPKPVGDIAPEYFPVPGFRYLQKSSLEWKIKMEPDDLLASQKSDHALPAFDVGCSVTLVPTNKKETEWKPQIVEDKLLSK